MNNNFKHCPTVHDFLSVVKLGLFVPHCCSKKILVRLSDILNVKCITLYVYNILTIYKLFTMLFLGVDQRYQHTLLFCMASCLLPISFFSIIPCISHHCICIVNAVETIYDFHCHYCVYTAARGMVHAR